MDYSKCDPYVKYISDKILITNPNWCEDHIKKTNLEIYDEYRTWRKNKNNSTSDENSPTIQTKTVQPITLLPSDTSNSAHDTTAGWGYTGGLNEYKTKKKFYTVVISNEEIIGRHFVANKNIKAGEVIFVDEPLILAPIVTSLVARAQPFCLSCFVKTSEMNCPKCAFYFCSTNCISSYNHQRECITLQQLQLSQDYENLNKLKMQLKSLTSITQEANISDNAKQILSQAIESTSQTFKTEVLKYYPLLATLRSILAISDRVDGQIANMIFNSLSGHQNKSSVQFKSIQKRIVKVIYTKLNVDVGQEFLNHVCAVWDTNSFEVLLGNGSIVQGLFPAASLLSHSCCPSAEQWFHPHDGSLILRAVQDIPEGEIITISYTDPLWPTRVRLHHLSTTKMFLCSCVRCTDKTELDTFFSSILCKTCHFLMHPKSNNIATDWLCDVCQSTITAKDITSLDKLYTSSIQKLDFKEIIAVQQIVNNGKFMEYHTTHHLPIRLRLELINYHVHTKTEELNQAELNFMLECSKVLLEICGKIFQFSKLCRQKARIAREYLRYTLEIWKRQRTVKDIKQEEIQFYSNLLSEADTVLSWDARTNQMDDIKKCFEILIKNN